MVLLDHGCRHPNEVQRTARTSRAECVRSASLTLLLLLGLTNSSVAEEPVNWGPDVCGEITRAHAIDRTLAALSR
jgi:hypothetical protein